MSTLIRILFGLCYLDFEIHKSCRGSEDSSWIRDVIKLTNVASRLMLNNNSLSV